MNRPLYYIIAAIATVLVLHFFVFHLTIVRGSSMEDTLSDGDLLLVTRFDYRFSEPERGDIVECTFPDREDVYIKRVIGLPGENVRISSGCTWIDGALLPESYLKGANEDYEIMLGNDEYLVLGDNRAESYDSREADMGTLRREDFKGRVRLRLNPPEAF